MATERNVVLCREPNKFARRAQLELHDQSVTFHGYQEFTLTGDSITPLAEDPNLQKKQELLAGLFRPRYLKHRTVLDLGANAGFFCFWALQSGAKRAFALDMDETYLQMVREAQTKLGFHNLDAVKANIADWSEPADIVVALALIHWIYSCTALLGSLDSAVGKLAELTKYMLVVEWVDPTDSAVTCFNHIDWNKGLVRGPYTLAAFEAALARHFPRYEHVGDLSPTRKLYVGFRSHHEIDLSGPLPLILPVESVLSSRCLSKSGEVEYWSRLYDGGEVIYKQATRDLAEREARFLSQLTGEHFPRVVNVKSEGAYSVLTLERIRGTPLKKWQNEVRSGSDDVVEQFFYHCLDILRQLREHGIIHRDIRPDNILVRNDKPVLIDFGWAISDERPYLTPPELGGSGRPPDGSFCDVYSMGRVWEQVNQHRFLAFDPVIELMVELSASLRITEPEILKTLCVSAVKVAGCGVETD